MNKVQEFIKHLEKKNLSKTTLKCYENCLSNFEVEKANFEDIKQKIINQNYKAGTQKTYKAIIKEFLKFNNETTILNELEFLKTKKADVVYRSVVSKQEIMDKTKIDFNDKNKIKKLKTLIRFVFETGIRYAEIKTIDLINERIYVLGKGNKYRQIFYKKETLNELLKFYPNLKIKINKKTFAKYIKKFLGKDISPHSLRRSFATHMLRNGANVKTIMLQMGHSDIQTTFKYLNLDEEYNKYNYDKYM